MSLAAMQMTLTSKRQATFPAEVCAAMRLQAGRAFGNRARGEAG